MRRRPSQLLLALLSAVLATSCTTVSEGEPGPASTPTSDGETIGSTPPDTSQPSDELPTDGAPAVANPLDTTAYQQDPCKALTSAQARELNVTPTSEIYDGGLGNGCQWFNEQTRGQTDVVFDDKDPRGLSALYAANKADKYEYFEQLAPIEGYPAIVRDVIDDRPRGNCTVVTGVTNEIAFEAIVQLSQANVGKKDPCDVAAQVAEMVLQTMKQGA